MPSLSFPLISIVIPTYNQACYLPESLDSVLCQTYSPFEIIVIDDGSTDATPEIGNIYTQKDRRVKWIKQINQGPSSARNRGIAAAQGVYICLLDSDDIMDPQRIMQQYHLFQEDPSIDIVYTALQLIDAQKNPLSIIRSHDLPFSNFLALMFFRNLIPTPSTLMAKSLCLKQHPYHPSFKHAEDYELSIRLAHLFHFKYLDLPLTSYRRHEKNLSNDLQAHRQAEQNVLKLYSRAHIEQIIDQTTFTNEEKTLLKGKILFNQESIEEALLLFQQLSLSLALFYQGNCYLYTKQFVLARLAYQQALAQDQTNPACYNNLGVTYALEGDFNEAKKFFEQAIALKKGYLDAQFNLQQAFPSSKWRITWRELRETSIPYV